MQYLTMKHLFFTLGFCLFLLSCDSDDARNPNCNFLFDVGVDVIVNLNLPQFNQLNFSGNSVFIPNAGNQGIIITRVGELFFAWDASDPNQQLRPCSVLEISGLEATSSCEVSNTYSLVSGQSLNEELECTLINYRLTQEGNTLFISN